MCFCAWQLRFDGSFTSTVLIFSAILVLNKHEFWNARSERHFSGYQTKKQEERVTNIMHFHKSFHLKSQDYNMRESSTQPNKKGATACWNECHHHFFPDCWCCGCSSPPLSPLLVVLLLLALSCYYNYSLKISLPSSF